MPRECTICKHKSRHEIDSALVSQNASIRNISQQYGVSKDALNRHVRSGHIKKQIQKAQLAYEAVQAESLLARIDRIYKRFDELAEKNKRLGDDKTELCVYKELRGYMEIEGRATGAFREKVEHSGSVEIVGALADEEVIERARSILTRK